MCGSEWERSGLMYLNVVVGLLGAAMCGYGAYVAYIAHVTAFPICLAVLGGFVVIFALVGFYGGKEATNWMLLLYFYVAVFLVAALTLFSVTALAFQSSVDSYVDHHWNSMQDEIQDFCHSSCSTKEETQTFLKSNFNTLGAVGLVCVVCLLFACHCAIRILTVPIIMKNMLEIINIMFFFVSFAVMAVGVYTMKHTEVEAGNHWIAFLFLGMGILLLIVSFAGIMGARNKDRSWLLFYILGVSLILICSLACGIGGFVFVHNLAAHYEARDTGKIACEADLFGCTNCTGITPVPCDYSITVYKPDKTARCTWDAAAKTCTSAEDGTEYTEAQCKAGTEVACVPPAGMMWVACAYSAIGSASGNWDCSDVWANGGDDAVPVGCNMCPEWDKAEVESYVETNLKFLGLLAFLLIIFLVVGVSGAVVLRKSLVNYQTDSI